MSFIDRIRWQCRLRPENPAQLLPGAAATATYGRLAHYLNSICRRLNEIGIVPGTVYGLLLDDALLHIVFTLALEELGAGTVLLHDMEIPQDWNLGTIFSDRDAVNSHRPIQRIHANWLHGDGDDDFIAERARAAGDQHAFVVQQSSLRAFPKRSRGCFSNIRPRGTAGAHDLVG